MGEARHLRKLLRGAGIEERCALCGRTQELEVDHIDDHHWNNDLDNLRYLCRPCHLARHYPKRNWEPEAFSPCPSCGKLALCGRSLVSGRYICPRCFRQEFKEAHGVQGRLHKELLFEYSHAYMSFLTNTPRHRRRE